LTLHPVALGETNGMTEMLMFHDPQGSSLLDAGYEQAVNRRLNVPLFRLDDYVKQQGLPQPEVVKLTVRLAKPRLFAAARKRSATRR